MQCIYSSVSKASLQKTGVFAGKVENGATGDFQQSEKPAIGGNFCHERRKFSEDRCRLAGDGARRQQRRWEGI
jgi:hypothetical protein